MTSIKAEFDRTTTQTTTTRRTYGQTISDRTISEVGESKTGPPPIDSVALMRPEGRNARRRLRSPRSTNISELDPQRRVHYFNTNRILDDVTNTPSGIWCEVDIQSNATLYQKYENLKQMLVKTMILTALFLPLAVLLHQLVE
jgi:hypothetical protein